MRANAKAIALRLVQFNLRVSTCHLIILLQNQSALFKSEFSCASILREMHAEGSSHLLDLSLNILQVCPAMNGMAHVRLRILRVIHLLPQDC